MLPPSNPSTGQARAFPGCRRARWWDRLAAALANLGIIFQPPFIVSADLREKRLVETLPEWRTEEVWFYAVYPAADCFRRRSGP